MKIISEKLGNGLFTLYVGGFCHVTRNDGGHIRIRANRDGVKSLEDLNAAELAALGGAMQLASEALKYALTKNGIAIGCVNVQINGNWGRLYHTDPPLCVHVYGRAYDAQKQPFGESLSFPSPRENPDFYAGNEPLTDADIYEIRRFIARKS